MSDFVHLHVHTEYSLLDGAAKIDALLDRVFELGQNAVAITDHGAMYGVVEFYKKAKARGIKPIIGCEVYVAPHSRFDKDKNLNYAYNHLVLLAKNNVGYSNLLKIVSDSFVNGYYYKPRTDFEYLSEHSEGLIALSACLAGEVQRNLIINDYAAAKNCVLKYKEVFGKDYYLELQNHNLEEDFKVCQGLKKLSDECSVNLVATNDTHYITREDSYVQKVLMCISMGKVIEEENPLLFKTDEFYIKSSSEMEQLFHDVPSAIENTNKIADECNVELDFSTMHLPKFKLEDNMSSFEYLKKLCYEGLKIKTPEYIQRLEYELSVINEMKFVDYFLIVSDFVAFAKRNLIAVGPGRGSATGSLVSYTLGITNIDPIKNGLIFERFLNASRVSMPDIDIDFCVERRHEVIEYLVSKYGEGSVAQIITFGTLAARAAIRDVGRVENIPFSTVESVCKNFSSKPGTTIRGTLEKDTDLKNRYENDENIKRLIDISLKVEGFPRHISTHAAGVVVTDGPVSDFLPLAKNDNIVITQYPKNDVEQLGLLKIDLLGLRNITVIDKTVKLIQNDNPEFSLENIPFDDANTFSMIAKGNTFGVFQLESAGMRKLLSNLQPNCVDDIIAAVSLYRPGPMDSIPVYLENRKNPHKIKYVTEKLRPILEDTYGCIVYQEQVMQIARQIAGFSLGHADILRAAMSKKKTDVMQSEKVLFISGAVENGVSKKDAIRIFEQMSEFAKYGFNKSHAAGYAVIAYQTAYLKANFPEKFMASLLSSVVNNTSKLKEYISECQRIGIRVNQPDINKSFADFYADNNCVYYSLTAVKSVGRKFAEKICIERKLNGDYKNFLDFVERMDSEDMNRRAVEALIKCGTFDCFGFSRRHMLSVYDKILGDVAFDKKQSSENQMSFFENTETLDYNSAYFGSLLKEFDKQKKLSFEKESLGLYLTEHPLVPFAKYCQAQKFDNIDTVLKQFENEEKVSIFGIVDSVRVVTTKQLKDMAYVTVEDVSSAIDVIVFPKLLMRYKSQIDNGAYVQIKGRVSYKNDDTKQIIADEIIIVSPELILDKFKKIYLKFKTEDNDLIEKIMDFLSKHPGSNPCVFYFEDTKKTLVPKGEFSVNADTEVVETLKSLLGSENIVIK